MEAGMFDSAVLDTVIGVVFVVILFSTVCAAVRESVESLLKTRASYLEYGIRELLNDKSASGLVTQLYTHPLVSGLFTDDYKPAEASARSMFSWGRRNLPSYIPAKNFASALIDIAVRGQVGGEPPSKDLGKIDLDTIKASVGKIENPRVARVLLNAVDLAEGDLNRAVANVEAWFDSGMDRVSGWYKRLSSRIILGIALVLAVFLNVDLIRVGRELYNDDAQRAMVLAYAQSAMPDQTMLTDRKKAFDRLSDKTFPVGWDGKTFEQAWEETGVQNLAGWLFTAFAATLGAPFWFDVLNKVMVIRATVKPHEKSREERSQDNN